MTEVTTNPDKYQLYNVIVSKAGQDAASGVAVKDGPTVVAENVSRDKAESVRAEYLRKAYEVEVVQSNPA